MRFDDYQKAARRTAIYADRHRVVYPALGLASEAGEVAGKIKKVLRERSKPQLAFPAMSSYTAKQNLSDMLQCLSSHSRLQAQREQWFSLQRIRSRWPRNSDQGC